MREGLQLVKQEIGFGFEENVLALWKIGWETELQQQDGFLIFEMRN